MAQQQQFELRERSGSILTASLQESQQRVSDERTHSVSLFQQQISDLRARSNSIYSVGQHIPQEPVFHQEADNAYIETQQHRPSEIIEFSLPPADNGKEAWLLLLGAFIIEGVTWGYAFSYGIFQEYYSGLALFQGQEAQIPVIGTTQTGIMYLCSPLALPLLRNYPHRRRQGMIAGLIVLCLAFVGSSFAQNVQQLIVTQGVLVGIGSSMTYYPVFVFIDEWFVRRKSFAYGIAWGASGLSGLGLPYLFSWLLENYTFRTTLRIWAIASLLLIAPAITVMKPRLPNSSSIMTRIPRLGFVRSPRFLVFCISSLCVALGFFLPGIYLPSYALSMGFSHAVATTSVSVLNIGAFFGFVTGGYLTDQWSSNAVLCCSTVGTTLSLLLLWGLSANASLLIVFALCYSFFGSCFVTTWPGTIRDIAQSDANGTVEPSTIYAFFIAGRGIGNVVSGPLSQVLLHAPRLTSNLPYGFGSGYGSLIVFAAISSALGGLGPLSEVTGMLR